MLRVYTQAFVVLLNSNHKDTTVSLAVRIFLTMTSQHPLRDGLRVSAVVVVCKLSLATSLKGDSKDLLLEPLKKCGKT